MTDPETTVDLTTGPAPGASPTYRRDAATQGQFEAAAASLWANDAWVDPSGVKHLYADLVLEGGGVKGIGLAGAILVLAEAGYHFPRAAGTSAGAIAATLVASIERAGKPMTELKRYLGQIEFSRFIDETALRHVVQRLGLGKVADVTHLMTHMGLYSGDYLAEFLTPILGGELGVRTFADLRISTQDDPGMSLPADHQYRLVVHASDITRRALVRLPWDYGDYGLDRDAQEVVGAVRASMSIPFFFEPVRVDAKAASVPIPQPGGGFEPKRWPGGQVTWVDGGMLSNFPIGAFDRADEAAPRWPTIGIKLSAQQLSMPADLPCDSSFTEAMSCLRTILDEWDKYHVDHDAASRTIFVDCGGITATQFDLNTDQQAQLFLSGATAATRFVIDKAASGGVPRGRAATPQTATPSHA